MNELQHHGIKGQKWGVRRFQNKNGTLTPAGKKRYADKLDISDKDTSVTKKVKADYNNLSEEDFLRKYHCSKETYAKRVEKHGDPYKYVMDKRKAKKNKKQAKIDKKQAKIDEKQAKKNKKQGSRELPENATVGKTRVKSVMKAVGTYTLGQAAAAKLVVNGQGAAGLALGAIGTTKAIQTLYQGHKDVKAIKERNKLEQ